MKFDPIIAICASPVFAGCTERTVTAPSSGLDLSVLSPLVTGDQWIYDVPTYDSTGVIVRHLFDTTIVGVSMDVSGEVWYFVSHNNDPNFTSLFANRKDGHYFLDQNGGNFPLLSTRFPVDEGYSSTHLDTVLFDTKRLIVSGRTVSFVSTTETVNVGDKQFSCYHCRSVLFTIDTLNKKTDLEDYISPGIGRIHSLSFFDGSFDPTTNTSIINGTEISTLLSYSLK